MRHNEDKLNVALSARVRWPVDPALCDDPHTKANLLLQCHFGRLALPIADYVTDTKTALDNSLRLLQAMVDVAADQGWLTVTLTLVRVIQVRPFDVGRIMLVGGKVAHLDVCPALREFVAKVMLLLCASPRSMVDAGAARRRCCKRAGPTTTRRSACRTWPTPARAR